MTELGVNWNWLFAATVTIIVAAEAVIAWASPAARIVEKSILWVVVVEIKLSKVSEWIVADRK